MIRNPLTRALAAATLGILGTLPIAGAARAGPQREPDAVVAADGTGQFKSVQDAINAAPQTSSASAPWTIRVRAGTYRERVYVQREKRFVRLVGEDPARTVITAALYASIPSPDGKPIGTFATPTVWIDADDFTVENLTLSNSALRMGQALALRVDGDRVRFRNCRFLGWQDTILANRGRHYFAGCTIGGAVDFIFGGATAFFDRCVITCAGDGYITAPSTPADQAYGLVFSGCRITGDDSATLTYLGRPWRPFGSAVFLNTEMSGVVRPAGWHNWKQPEREKTARFAEFGSTGPGANPSARVPWSRSLSRAEADAITVQRVLAGTDGWDPTKAAD
jgi:pectinesterase